MTTFEYDEKAVRRALKKEWFVKKNEKLLYFLATCGKMYSRKEFICY